MAYLQNIPQPNDQLRNSQGDLLGNFQAINTFLAVNHENFASGDAGKHAKINLTNQVAIPPFNATETGFYNKIDANTTQNETWVKINNLAATKFVPMTSSSLGAALPANFTNGWTYLPSGILMEWVVVNSGANTGRIFQAMPRFQNIFAIIPVCVSNNPNPNADPNMAVTIESIQAAPIGFNIFFSRRTIVGPTTGIAQVLVIGV
jgi:hypothetical protein